MNNDQDIQLIQEYLVIVYPEACSCIGKAKLYHLISKITVFDAKNRFLLVHFTNSHSVIDTCQIKLGKLLCPTYSILGLINQNERILILYGQMIMILVIDK